jgi:hypothetical protein
MNMRLPGKSLLLAVLFVTATFFAEAMAETGPEIVELDGMVSYYGPVTFDHVMHVELTEENCAECHHHTTGMAPQDERCIKCHKGGQESDVIACRECHPSNRFAADYLASVAADPSLYHTDKPGYKGAFHRKCLGCHKEMDGPAGCQGCHERNESGDAFFHAGKFAPTPNKVKSGH